MSEEENTKKVQDALKFHSESCCKGMRELRERERESGVCS
jgi:hypothetical protein